MIVDSHTKINLGLKVLNQRPDSYHNIETVFIEIDFGDKLTIKKLESGCKISSNADWMPLDSTNLCHKAYKHMSEFADKDFGVSIYLEKRVPAGSGLGGGSANAAEIIKSLNSIYDLKMSQNDLEQVASKIGSDVPFFIRGKKQVGEGTGTKLTPIDFPMNKKILLVIPEFLIDTGWAYSQINLAISPSCINQKLWYNQKYFLVHWEINWGKLCPCSFSNLLFSTYKKRYI